MVFNVSKIVCSGTLLIEVVDIETSSGGSRISRRGRGVKALTSICTKYFYLVSATNTMIIMAGGQIERETIVYRWHYTTSSPILKSWLHRENVLQWQGTCRCYGYVQVQEGGNRGLSISINPSLQHGIWIGKRGCNY